MSVATALAAGSEASPRLATTAVRQALEKAGLEMAGGVVLFLSAHFSRQPQAAVVAAARAAGCLQVFGMAVPGLFTESGWVLDQPAAAALVLGGGFSLAGTGAGPRLSLLGKAALAGDWQDGGGRFGLLQEAAPVWQQGRLAAEARGEAVVRGGRCRLAVSTGLRRLGPPQVVGRTRGHDLERVGGLSALESLDRALPPEFRERLPAHLLAAVREGENPAAIPLLSANADGSLTLAERLQEGERIVWTLRQPLAAESDMRASLENAAAGCPAPAFALMLSCIGRGPLFYGSDDRDLAACRERFPGLPLIGAYGSGQIAPAAGANRQLHNSVVTALFEIDRHV